jgi:16S rRNA (uracil1498-N3)-methyltransferase
MAHVCEMVSTRGRQVTCRIVKSIKNSGEPRLYITLAIGLSTGSKFDTIIEKGTETGVSRFVPLLTEKGKVRISEVAAAARKVNRWRRVGEAAVKQSGRSVIPKIDPPISFSDFIRICIPNETILFDPGGRFENIRKLIPLGEGPHLTLVVGPESGFSPTEMAAARERHIAVIGIGPRVLRTETAGVVLPALVVYLSEIGEE